MSKQHIEQLMQAAFESLRAKGSISVELPPFQVDTTKDKNHGDFACNIALVLAKSAGRSPRDLAKQLVEVIPASPQINKVEIAGPGFINFFLSSEGLYRIVPEILSAGDQFGRSNQGKRKRIIVEFVSANPNGPLHVGHGRHAAYGAVVSDLLEAIGYDVCREYYVNDAGRQMDIVTVSTWLRYLSLCGENITFPCNAYRGGYVIDIAHALKNAMRSDFVFPADKLFCDLPLDEPAGGDKDIYIDALVVRAKTLLGDESYGIIFDRVLSTILSDIRDDLAEFGVQYQSWFSERDFVKTDVVDRLLADLAEKGSVYEQDGALWFRSSDFGDEKDRVLQRSNGVRTYFANDLAYHIHKFERGFEHAIDIFGADHHGYIPRMKAGLEANGIPQDRLTYLLVQFVTLYRGGQQVQMSTRSGSFITLRELRAEVGNDAARFFYVMRKCEQHVDFDLDLAKSQSNENPVYYIQYAYARICSVFKQLKEKAWHYDPRMGEKHLDLLVEPQEITLLTLLGRYSDVIHNAALQHEPHQLTHYMRELATGFHSYYNSHPFLVDDEPLRQARLVLVGATRQLLANGLKLLGISTPEQM